MPDSVLVVEDKDSHRQMLMATLAADGYSATGAADGKEGLSLARERKFDVFLVDLRLPKQNGLDVLRALRAIDPGAIVILMTAFGTIETAVQAMKEGARDYLTKPVDTDHLLLMIRRALDERALATENIVLKEDLETRLGAPRLIGDSPAMRQVFGMATRVADSNSTVLLLGESGTGKELFARRIHELSPRSKRPFVAINCAAIPHDLLENELFGSEKGAYTSSTGRKIGKFELADHGTLFLDEVGDLDLSLQAKILRVLQEFTFERLGGTQTLTVDVRVVAASNKDLRVLTQAGAFREDLYYRLSVFPITLPPLRERKQDIPDLVDHFLGAFAREMKKPKRNISAAALELLLAHDWPGNIRELENTIERALILCEGDTLERENILIGPAIRTASAAPPTPVPDTLRAAKQKSIEEAERALIERVLRECGGNKSKVARQLKVSYRVLLKKIKDYQIEFTPFLGS
jgi:DNA-binding NtrC family response regulator